MEKQNYFKRNLNDREKMVYYFEKYKEALSCQKKEEASKFLRLAHHYLKESQIIKEEMNVE